MQKLTPIKENFDLNGALYHYAVKKDFDIIIEQDEDGFFVASVPELRGCHTQAKSLDVLIERIKEAIELYLEVKETEIITPRFVGIERMTIEL